MNTQNTAPRHDKTVGMLVALFLLLLALLAGGWYVMQGQGGTPMMGGMPEMMGGADVEVDAATAALEKQGTSDEVADIEADLTATDLGSLDEVSGI